MPCTTPHHAGDRQATQGTGPAHPRGVRSVQPRRGADGALPAKTKQLIAVAVAHTTQCLYCIRGHTRLAHRAGAQAPPTSRSRKRSGSRPKCARGGAYAHSTLALEALSK